MLYDPADLPTVTQAEVEENHSPAQTELLAVNFINKALNTNILYYD